LRCHCHVSRLQKNDSKDVSQMTVAELQTTANQGNDQAMVRLGLFYDVGRGGVMQDTNEAIKWYRKAANDGNADGQFTLGYCYFIGRDVNQNFPEAIKWFVLAANAGQPKAQMLLGESYARGLGVEKNN
jgi:hypothetical protein